MPSTLKTLLIAASSTLVLTLAVVTGGDAVAATKNDENIASWSPSDLQVSKTLNPITIGACNAGLGDVSVAALNAKGFGKIDLKCGNDKAGYVHIRTKHQRDWQVLVDQAGGGAPWDDLMMFALVQATSAPMSGFPRATPRDASKLCYVTPIQLKNRQGRVIKTLYPSVVVSKNNRIVITNFPTSAPYCN